MDDIPKHQKLRRPKQEPARLTTLKLPTKPFCPEMELKLPALQVADRVLQVSDRDLQASSKKFQVSDRKPLVSEDQNPLQEPVPRPPRCPKKPSSRKSKDARKAAGAERVQELAPCQVSKFSLTELYRAVEAAGAAFRSALAEDLAEVSTMMAGGSCDKMLPVTQTSYCVLPPIESSSRPVEPIKAWASATPAPLDNRCADVRVSTCSSPPPPLPLSPPLSPCQPEAQSPALPPPTLDDPLTRETTLSHTPLEEDELSVSEAMIPHLDLLRKNKSVTEEESELTSQEVGQPGADDVNVPDTENQEYPDDFHEEEEEEGLNRGTNDVAVGALTEEEEKDEEVQDRPSSPSSSPETPSLQSWDLVQEVAMPPRPSTLHHQTLHDLLHRLVGRLALQVPLRSCFAPTHSEIEAMLLRDVRWFLRNMSGISLVQENEPQDALFSGADALDAMFEATWAELMFTSNMNRAQVHSALQGGEGIVCVAEIIAKVICHHAEVWCPSAVSGESRREEKEKAEEAAGLEKASGSFAPLTILAILDEGLELESAGLEKAAETHFSSFSPSPSSSSASRGSTALVPSLEEDHQGPLAKVEPPILQRSSTLKKEKALLKDGQKVAPRGKKTCRIFRTNTVSALSCESPDLGEPSVDTVRKEKKTKKKSIKAFFRRISAALSRAFCCGCVEDALQ